jgi:hypothetical protein
MQWPFLLLLIEVILYAYIPTCPDNGLKSSFYLPYEPKHPHRR